MIPPPYDQTELIIQRGAASRSLLENPAFQFILDDQTSFHLSALVAAPPGPASADTVAHHHTLIHAFTEITSALQGFAAAGEAAQRALHVDDDDADLVAIGDDE